MPDIKEYAICALTLLVATNMNMSYYAADEIISECQYRIKTFNENEQEEYDSPTQLLFDMLGLDERYLWIFE